MSRPEPPGWKPCAQCKTKTNRADGVCASCRILGLEAQIKRMRDECLSPKQKQTLQYIAEKLVSLGDVEVVAKETGQRIIDTIQGRKLDDGFYPTGWSHECACCRTYKSRNIVCDTCLARAKAVKEGVDYAKEVCP